MKHLLLILLSIVALSGRAQISDFTIAKPEFELSLRIIDRYIDDTAFIAEYGYVYGWNKLIVFDLTIINMGQHDAAFPDITDANGNILPDSVLHEMGLYWDGFHWHIHAEGIFTIYLEDVCHNVIDSSSKIGFNFQDMGNIMLYLQTLNGYELNEWLNEFGTPSYILALHPPNDNFNGDTRMGISAGYYDTYSAGTWGNSIPYHAPGDYFIRPVLNVSRWFNEGLDIFPNTFTTAITITPQQTIALNSHTTVCPPPCDASNPDPQTITVANGIVNFPHECCDVNDLEIIIWHTKSNGQEEYRTHSTIPLTTETSYDHSNRLSERDLERYIKRFFRPVNNWDFNGGSYSWGYKIGKTIYKP